METNITKRDQDASEYLNTFVIKQVENSDVLATSNKLPDDEFSKDGLQSKLLPPPYDPFKLSILVESSSILSSCIDTMEVNCDAFGFELVPSVDEETFKDLKEEQEKTLGARPKDTGTKTDKPTRQETEIEAEYRRMMNFWKYANRVLSLTELRRRTRRDYELTGNAFWEVLRNQLTQRITGIEWLPSVTMRIGRVDKRFTDYQARRKVSDTEIESYPDKRKFRRFAQIRESGTKPTWFKEFGDPRLMDAETGGRAIVTYDDKGKVKTIMPEPDADAPFDVEKFKAGKMRLATEVLHFPNYQTARALPYGVPRWIGNLISIIGSRSAEEVNLLYFDNKTVPPGMLLVAGGKLSSSATDRITNHIKENIKGSKNFHSILVIEAESKQTNPNMPAKGIPKIEWVPMLDAQHNDALFMKYDESCINKIIGSFRFWGGYVGRTKEINLATAQVAMQISEQQVFGPEREHFDSVINRTLMVEMGVNYWEFKTKGPKLSMPKETADILAQVKGFITVAEGRKIVSQIFGKEFEELEQEWTKKPLELVIAELGKANGLLGEVGNELGISGLDESGKEKNPKVPKKPDDKGGSNVVKEFVQKLLVVRKALEEQEIEAANELVHGQKE